MGEKHSKGTSLNLEGVMDLLSEIRDGMNETQKIVQKPINIKADSKEVHAANQEVQDLFKNLNNLKKTNTLQKYFTDAEKAQENLTKAYERYQERLKSGSEKQKKQAAGDVARYANAFTALGGNTDVVDKKIKQITSKYMKNNNPSTGWLYGVENFKEAFAIMQQIENLAPGTFFKQLSSEADKASEAVRGAAKKTADAVKNNNIAKNIFDSDEGEAEANKLVEVMDKIWARAETWKDKKREKNAGKEAVEFASAFQKLNYYLEQTPRKMDDARASLVDFKTFLNDIYDFLPESQREELTDFMMAPNGQVDQKAMLGVAIEYWQDVAKSIDQASDAKKNFYTNKFIEIPQLTEAQKQYRRLVDWVREYYDLVQKSEIGNRSIVPYGDDALPLFVYSGDTRRKNGQLHTTQASLKRLLSDYDDVNTKGTFNEQYINNLIDRIAAYTYALDKSVDAEKLFGKAHAELFAEVALRIKNAEEAADAFAHSRSLTGLISSSAKSMGGNLVTFGDFDKFEKVLLSSGVEGALQYLVETLGMKLPEVTKESTEALDSEAASTKNVGNASEESADKDDKAAESKKKKAKASKESAEAAKEEADAEAEAAKKEEEAAKKREEAQKTSKYNAELLKKQFDESRDRVFKNETHNPNGAKTVTDFVDYFRTRTTKTSYNKNGELQILESTKENYVALEKQILQNDKAITQYTKDMYLNADANADLSAWQNRIDALKEYNRVLLEIRNNVWVGSDDYQPGQRHADVFDAERLKAQEKDWETIIAAAQTRLKDFISSAKSLSKKDYMAGFSAEINDLLNNLQDLSTAQIDFKNPNIDVVRTQVVEFLKTLRGLENTLNDVNSRATLDVNIPVRIDDIRALDNGIMTFLDNNTAAGKRSKEALEAVHKELQLVIKSGGQLSKVRFDELTASVNETEAEVRRLHQTGNSFFRSFTKQLKSANAQFFATYFSLQDIIRYARAIITTVTQVDSALTELRKVSDASTERLAQNFETSAETAKELGSSITHVINVTADWARLGYDVDAAEKLARVTTLFTTVGDNMSADDASSYLISTLQGYQLAADEAEDIVDKYNQVANNFAIDTRGIGEALQRSAASFNSANTDLSKSIALITATNEVVQNPEAVGTLWKTLSARIRGAKTELKELGEEEDAFTNTTSKLRDLVKALTGFDIMDDKDNFKDIYEIILGIGKEWDNLTDIERASLGEALAGKRNANALYAVLGNLDTLEGAYKAAEESAGSAAREQENYAKSIQYSLDRFIATLQELETDFLNSQLLKDIVDFGTTIVDILDDIVEHIGLIGSVGTAAGIFAFVKLFPKIKRSFKATREILNILSQTATATDALAVATGDLSYAQAAQILTLAGVDEAAKADILAKAGLTAANGTATISVEAFTAALWGNIKALGVWLITNPVGWLILAAGAVASAAALYDAFTISVSEATDALNEFHKKYDDMSSDIKNHEKYVNELSDSYFELAKGVDSISGKNISLSTEDYEEFVSTNQELAEMFPELIRGVDEYGNYILDLGANADESREKLKNLLEQEKEHYDYQLYKDLPEVFKNEKVIIESIQKSIENLEGHQERVNTAFEQLENLTADFSVGDMLKVESVLEDDEATAYATEFWNAYAKAIANASNDPARKQRLQDALLDYSTNGSFNFAINLTSLTSEDRGYLKEQFEIFSKDYAKELEVTASGIQRELAAKKKELQSEWQGLLPSLVGSARYLANDDETRELATAFIGALSSDMYDVIKDQPIDKVVREWVGDISNLPAKDRLKLKNILDPTLTPAERVQLYNDLMANLPEGIKLPVEFIVKDDQDLLNRVEQSKKELTTGSDGRIFGRAELDDFFTQEQIDTAEEYERWLRAVARAGGDAAEAMRLYREEAEKIPKPEKFSLAQFIEQDDDLESLQTLYNSFRENVEGDKIKVPLDISDVEGLREKWEAAVGAEEFHEFEITVTADSSSVAEVQGAFDKLATSYARNMIKIKGATKETMELVKSQMKLDGLEAKGVNAFVDAVVAEDKMDSFIATLETAQDKQGNMADGAVDAAADIYKEAQALGITDEMLKDYLVKAALAGNVVLGGDTSWLDELAEKLGIDISLLKELLGLANQGSGFVTDEKGGVHSIYGGKEAEENNKRNAARQKENELNNKHKNLNLFPTAKDAAGAGKDAGDAYVEAFEKELKALEEQRDAGIITEKEFLDKYRSLIEKYFKDVDGYGEEYAKRMGDYFQRAISYYESIFSAIGTLLDKKISAAQEGKDAAVSAIEAERDAALKAYDEQLEAIDRLIKAKQDQLDKLRDEHDQRQRNLNLQRAEYELQRAQSQRTKLIYKGNQLVYETDKKDIRDKKEAVEDAEYENAVAEIEKEIKALEKQREEIEKNREAAEKYYNQLIEDTEKYWDSIIDALEKQKSKWEELAEIKEIANAYALIQEAGESLGYSVEDILNDVPGAFEAFRDAYLNILKEANSGNQNFLDGLSYATSTAKESVNIALSEIAGKASEVDKALEPLGEVSSKVGDTATALGNVASSSATAASNTETLSSNLDGVAKSAEDISKVENSVKGIADASLGSTVQAFQDLAKALKDCADALGIGDGEMSAFQSAIDALGNVSLGDEKTGAIGAFNSLAGAISGVVSAIGAGGGGGVSTDATNETAPSMSDGAGLIGAIEDVKKAAVTNIGSSAGGDTAGGEGGEGGEGGGGAEDGGTAISSFEALATAVGEVSKIIGNTKDEYSEDGTTLINAIKGLPVVGSEAITGKDGIKGMFDELLQVIQNCVSEVETLLKKLAEFESAGGLGSFAPNYKGNVHINGHKDGNVHGNAYASGRLGLKKSENALVGELGQELVYNPATGTYRTVGDHGPEITRLQKGDLIFNAEQTKAIIKHGKRGGNSYANGSGLMPLSDAEMNMFKTMGNALVGIKADTSQMLEPIKAIAQNINKVTTNNISPTINISGTSFTVSGVTGEAVTAQIRDVFSNLIGNAYQRATKM